MARRLADIDCTLHWETEKAWKVTTDVARTPVWVPKSMGKIDREDDQYPREVVLTLYEWWAKQNGLI